MTKADPHQTFLNYGVLVTELHYSIGGILISHRATHDKIHEMLTIKWYDPKSDRWDNKQRMKELGGSIMSYQKFLMLNSITSVANFLESFHALIKCTTGQKLNIWDSRSNKLPHITDARMAHALSNVIKHNQAIIQRSSSTSARYLVDFCGIQDGIPVELAPIDIESLLFKMFVFGNAVIQKVTKYSGPLHPTSKARLRNIFEALVPDITQLNEQGPRPSRK